MEIIQLILKGFFVFSNCQIFAVWKKIKNIFNKLELNENQNQILPKYYILNITLYEKL